MREKGGARESEREKEGGRKSEIEGERKRCRIFLKGMTGALAPFSYLVVSCIAHVHHKINFSNKFNLF